MNFGILCKHLGTVTQCSVDPHINLIFGRLHRKIGIYFGNPPIADFFHDQTIFIKDCKLYTIGHSLILFKRPLANALCDIEAYINSNYCKLLWFLIVQYLVLLP